MTLIQKKKHHYLILCSDAFRSDGFSPREQLQVQASPWEIWISTPKLVDSISDAAWGRSPRRLAADVPRKGGKSGGKEDRSG